MEDKLLNSLYHDENKNTEHEFPNSGGSFKVKKYICNLQILHFCFKKHSLLKYCVQIA